jgi:hypothetical protein
MFCQIPKTGQFVLEIMSLRSFRRHPKMCSIFYFFMIHQTKTISQHMTSSFRAWSREDRPRVTRHTQQMVHILWSFSFCSFSHLSENESSKAPTKKSYSSWRTRNITDTRRITKDSRILSIFSLFLSIPRRILWSLICPWSYNKFVLMISWFTARSSCFL